MKTKKKYMCLKIKAIIVTSKVTKQKKNTHNTRMKKFT